MIHYAPADVAIDVTIGGIEDPMGALLPLAHAGHWLEGALFAPAMVVVVAAIARSLRKPGRRISDDS